MDILKRTLICLTLLTVPAGMSANTRAQESSSPNATVYIEHARVAASYATPPPTLATGQAGAGTYKVITVRRDKTSEVEIHKLDTDVIYVTGGAAIMVTGGKIVGAKQVSPNEIRGTSIEGGTEYHMSQGDVMVIPPGTPHWSKDVQAPFLYFEVKVH